MELTFDIKKIKKVKIDDIRPNTWNPKEKNHEKVQDIKKSIEIMGFKEPVKVRDNNGYEIIDGEQRWTAMKELGAKEIYIYDNGIVSDEDAMNETIWWQVQIPFDEIKLAPIIVKLAEMNFEVPYSAKQIEDFKQLAEFKFEDYNQERPEDEDDGVKTLHLVMGEEAYNVIMQAIKKAQEIDPDNISDSRAVELICADYLGS